MKVTQPHKQCDGNTNTPNANRIPRKERVKKKKEEDKIDSFSHFVRSIVLN